MSPLLEAVLCPPLELGGLDLTLLLSGGLDLPGMDCEVGEGVYGCLYE